VPPGVGQALLLQRRISRKRGKYHQGMEKWRKQADAMMLQSEMDVSTVEALMACPLSRFIHFAANDCGYKGTRYELIANWVHPLFLKLNQKQAKRITQVGNKP
jgi:hypothetical protein